MLTHKIVISRHELRDSQLIRKWCRSSSASSLKADKLCFFCQKADHLIADCVAWERKQQGAEAGAASKQPKGVGLVKNVCPGGSSTSSRGPDDCFKPFTFEGFVSLTGKSEDRRQVTVPRDIGSSQLFILASAMPFTMNSACDVSTIVRGMGMSFVPVPLHLVYMKSKLVSRFFPVAVHSHFPGDGVGFIMGNDIAGGKVYPGSKVVDDPISQAEPSGMAQKHPNVFTMSVTRAQAQGVDLSGSLLASALSEDRWPSSDDVRHCMIERPADIKLIKSSRCC